MQDPAVQAQLAQTGAWAEGQREAAGEARSRMLGQMGVNMFLGLASSFIPGAGYAQMAAQRAMAAGQQAQMEQNMAGMMQMSEGVMTIMPQMMRGQRAAMNSAQAKQCAFLQEAAAAAGIAPRAGLALRPPASCPTRNAHCTALVLAWGEGLVRMRQIVIAAALASLTLSLPGCAALEGTQLVERGTVMETSRRIAERYASSWNANDMAAFGALYAGDARHVNVSGDFLRGRAAIVAAHRANRARFAEGVRMVTRLEGARAITNDAIVAVMRMEIVNDPARPNAVQATVLTLTLARREGSWLIAQAQASTPD